TLGEDDSKPQCSSDGKWLYFGGGLEGKPGIYRVSTEGGTPERVLEVGLRNFVLLPDDKTMFVPFTNGTTTSDFRRRAGLFSLETGKMVIEFPPLVGRRV